MADKRSCKLCGDIPEKENISNSDQLSSIIVFAKNKVEAGEFFEVETDSEFSSGCRIEELPETDFGIDIIGHEFQCTKCRSHFVFRCDTNEGNGSWEKIKK